MTDVVTDLDAAAVGSDALLIAGIVQAAKIARFNSDFAGVLAIFVGLAFGLLRYGITPPAIFHGVLSGLGSTGLYEFAKNGRELMVPAKAAGNE